jgi:hypothetical protein
MTKSLLEFFSSPPRGGDNPIWPSLFWPPPSYQILLNSVPGSFIIYRTTNNFYGTTNLKENLRNL